MRIKCKASDLAHAFELAGSAIPARSTLSVLGCALIEATDGLVRVSGTDLSRYVTCGVVTDAAIDGEICLPVKQTSDLLNRLGSAVIDLDADKETKRVTIKSGGGKWTLSGISPDEFPPVPDVEPLATVTLGGKQLRAMLRQTLFAASKEESRGVMKGVLFEVTHGNINSRLTLVATDTARLSATGTVVECKGTEDVSSIIEAKNLTPLLKPLDNAESVTIRFSQRLVEFAIGPATFLLNTLEGQYPNWKKVVPQTDGAATIRIGREALHDALRRADIVLGEGEDVQRRVRFNVAPDRMDDDRRVADLQISASDGTAGSEGFEGVPCIFETDDRDVVRVATKCDYWLDYLSVAQADEILIYTTGELQPLLIRELSESGPDENYTHLIIGMNYE